MPRAARVVMMDGEAIQDAVQRMVAQLVERGEAVEGLGVVGIRTRGVPLAHRLAEGLAGHLGALPPVGVLDINLYRDDLSMIADHPVLKQTEIPFRIDDSRILLVDDVLFTGRTIRAALDSLMDLGRPAVVRLAVLVDRGHREVPIQADIVGHAAKTARTERVDVKLAEIDGADEVVLVRPRPPSARDGGDRP